MRKGSSLRRLRLAVALAFLASCGDGIGGWFGKPIGVEFAIEGVSFQAEEGGAEPAAQTVAIDVTPDGTAWTASTTETWLSVSPASGNGDSTLTVSVSVAGLTEGQYQGNVIIDCPATGLGPFALSVTVVVSPSSDLEPPSAIADLRVSDMDFYGRTFTVSWTAPGDDGDVGTAASYDIRVHTEAITDANWGAATPLTGAPTPLPAGTGQSYLIQGLQEETLCYLAIKTSDDAGKVSPLSNVVHFYIQHPVVFSAPYVASPGVTVDGTLNEVVYSRVRSYICTPVEAAHTAEGLYPLPQQAYRFFHDGTYLHVAIDAQRIINGWNDKGRVLFDGNHDLAPSGNAATPHVDFWLQKSAPSAWSGYNIGGYVLATEEIQCPWSDLGSTCASANSTSTTYEFKIPLAELNVGVGATVGVRLGAADAGGGSGWTERGDCLYPQIPIPYTLGKWVKFVADLTISTNPPDPGWTHGSCDMAGTSYNPYPTDSLRQGALAELWSDPAVSQFVYILSGDVDGDGELEAVLCQTRTVRIYSGDGTLESSFELPGSVSHHVFLLADVDSDGDRDLFLHSEDEGGTLTSYAYDAVGSQLQTYVRGGVGNDSSISPVALLPDGKLLVRYTAGFSQQPRGWGCFDSASGSNVWHYELGSLSEPYSVVDVPSVGSRIVGGWSTTHNGHSANGTSDGDIYTVLLTDAGTAVFTQNYSSNGPTDGNVATAIADLDKDGTYQVLAIETHDPMYYPGISQAHLLNIDTGAFEKTVDIANDTGRGLSAAIADFDGDGKDEFVFATGGDGATYATRMLDDNIDLLAYTCDAERVWAANDIDGDGQLEVIASKGAQLRIYDSTLATVESSFDAAGNILKAIVSDVNGDGLNEVVFWGGMLYCVQLAP